MQSSYSPRTEGEYGCQGLQESGELLFNGTVSVWEDEGVLEIGWWCWLYSDMNVINAAELHTEKKSELSISCYMYFITHRERSPVTLRELPVCRKIQQV